MKNFVCFCLLIVAFTLTSCSRVPPNYYGVLMENFGKNGKSSGFSYWDLPNHSQGLRLVYHWGRVYYFLYGGNYCPIGQLLDVNTLNILQWAHIRNVAPIFNTETKTLV